MYVRREMIDSLTVCHWTVRGGDLFQTGASGNVQVE